MKKTIIVLLSTVLICLFSFGKESYAMLEPKIEGAFVIRDVTIVNTETGRLEPHRTVLVEGNAIKRISGSCDASVFSRNVRVIEGKGKYLIPGLWDMHVHLLDNRKIAFPSLLANGVTGVRDMGAEFNQVMQWKQSIDKGELAPRIVYSGPILDGAPLPLHRNIQSTLEARNEVKKLKRAGVDFIKVYTWLPADIYAAIVDEARKQGLTVAGHVPIDVGAAKASEAGQTSIEHLYGIHIAVSNIEEEIYKAPPTHNDNVFVYDLKAAEQRNPNKERVLFETFKRNHTWQVPTLVTFQSFYHTAPDDRIPYVPTETQAQWMEIDKKISSSAEGQELKQIMMKIFQENLELVGRMHRAGVPLMAGTDANLSVEPLPNLYYGFSLHDELELFVKAGLKPLEALQSATLNPAIYLQMRDSLGTVEEGKLADLVLLNANPLEDIRNTRKIEAVVSNGRLLDKEELNQMLVTYPSPEAVGAKR